jgi:DNA repair exonuclease SbcCD ATPase subunit
VTDEITRILGMDSAGFRLATIAQQKDLDGLASLTPATRTRMVSRLLRLDALTRARESASELHHTEARIAAQLRPLQPLAQFQSEQAQSAKAVRDAQLECDRTRSAVTELQLALQGHQPFLAEWHELHERLGKANTELFVAENDLQRLSTAFEGIVVPAASEFVEGDLAQLTTEVADCERAIAAAETARSNAEHRRIVSSELDLLRSRLAEIGEQSTVEPARQTLDQVQTSLVEVQAHHTVLQSELDGLVIADSIDAIVERDLEGRSERAALLGSDCDSCGQGISEEHRELQLKQLETELDELRMTANPRRVAIADLRSRISAVDDEIAALNIRATGCTAELDAANRADVERKELLRRRDTYLDQISRLPDLTVDVETLYAKKTGLALRVARTQAAREADQIRNAALLERAQVSAAVSSAEFRVAAAVAAVQANTPDEDLVSTFAAVESARANLVAEEKMFSFNTTELAVARERLSAADVALERAQAEEERRLRHQEVALNAGNAKRLLTDVAERLSTTVRPALEGAIANLLTTMSEGRFTKVTVSDDYEIRVEDEGKLRPLSELSGGEADLVALSTRLALAQIVSERHGSGGAGFLILDEPLGSQDPIRRQSILSGLRALRGTYDQIFLISHVDGLEDSADVVINITASEDRLETVVDVT